MRRKINPLSLAETTINEAGFLRLEPVMKLGLFKQKSIP